MKLSFQALPVLAALLVAAPLVQAQRSPNIGYIYPAGGRQGSTFQAAISGQYLDGLTNVLFSGQGVQGTIVEFVKPLNGKQLNLMRDRLRNMQQGLRSASRTDTVISFTSEFNTNQVLKLGRAAVELEIADIKQKLSNPKNQRPPNPQLAEDVTLKIVVAADAEPGEREMRLMTAAGLSNPMTFHVGRLPEYSKKAEVSLSGPRSANPLKYRGKSASGPAAAETRISPPCVVNGQIMPGGVDRYRFSARKGQRMVVDASARKLIPYIADAVPGWFQATLALYDAKGKELAYDDDFLFNPDPVLYYEIPADGDYAIEIKDAIYRGREDFVYRLTVGELPFVTGIFPLGGRVGEPTTVELKGWNLAATTLTTTPKESGTTLLVLNTESRAANPVPFAVDTLPECLEQEPNNAPEEAQLLKLPIMVNGRINQPEDWDLFRFDGRAGDQIVAEVFARRLNSPLDSVLKLTDSAGRQVALNDDHEDRGAGLTTHHADSRISLTLPTTGTYRLRLGDAQGKGGPGYAYRLRVSAPQPDFELRVAPASVNVRPGSSAFLTVFALRKDGFTNEISFALKNAPAGFWLTGGRMPGHTNQVRLSLAASGMALRQPLNLVVEGRARIAGQEVVRQALPAEDMMQAFAYRHLVLAKELKVAVIGRGGAGNPAKKAAKQKK